MGSSNQIENRLVRDAWGVLRSHPALMIFPVLSGLGVLAPVAPMIWSIQVLRGNDAGPLPVILLMVFMTLIWIVVGMTVANFFNAALIAAADRGLRRQAVGVMRGGTTAVLRLPSIVVWSTAEVLIELSRGRWAACIWSLDGPGSGQQFTSMMSRVGIEWADASHLVTPVLALERTGPLAAARRSMDLVGRTWGTNACAVVIFRRAGPVTMLVSATLVLLGIGHGIWSGVFRAPLAVAPAAIGMVLATAYLTVASALRAVMKLGLYRFAVDGAPPPGFDAATMECAMEGGHKAPQAPAPERA